MNNPTNEVVKNPLGLTYLAHRQLIGWLGIMLPVLIVVISWLWPVPDVSLKKIDSISAFYYTSATGVFVGSLFALAMFLITYGGYKGDFADQVLGKIAGFAAIGVAFFPTKAPQSLMSPPWWAEWMGTAHYTSAILLFLSFILFAMWIFRRTSVTQKKVMSKEKIWRNRVFFACGLIMIVSVVWAVIALKANKPIFWPEAIALVTFAISWLVKGRAYDLKVAWFIEDKEK